MYARLLTFDLGGHPPRHTFCTCPRSSITLPNFELIPSNLKFDLTFDLAWPRGVLLDIYFTLALGLASPSQVWAQSEQFEIWPDIWPHLTSEGILLDTHFALALGQGSPSLNLSSIRATWNLTRPLTSDDLLTQSALAPYHRAKFHPHRL